MQSLAIPEEVCTAVCKDSREQFRPITIGKNHLAADHEMNIPSIVGRLNNFVLFLVFRYRFVKEFLCWCSWGFLILLMRKSLRWVDLKGIFSLCFARHSKMAAHLGCFEWYDLKWDSFASPCLDWSTFHKTLKGKYWSSILYGRPLLPPPSSPRPHFRFRVIFHLKLIMCRSKWCDVWHFNHTSVGLTWENIPAHHKSSLWVLFAF